jgi:phage gp36-like protein
MAYTTLQALTDRFGERLLIDQTDRATPAAGVIDTEVVDRALADTDAVIDGYLAGRYRLPMDVTPPLVADLAASIAIYKLHVYAPDPKIDEDYKQAMKMLGQIATGVVQLSVAGVEAPSSGGGQARIVDRERPFTAENLTGWI